MKKTITALFIGTAALALSACSGEKEVSEDMPEEMAEPMAEDTMMDDTMMDDTMMDDTTEGGAGEDDTLGGTSNPIGPAAAAPAE
jgi:hypothetical protein